jgi:glycosyltransferase involved in cell wall biosynthesis
MRLLYLCSDFGIDPAGTKGASVHLRAITQGLADLGCEIRLLSPKAGPGDDHPAKRILPAGCPPVDQCGRLLKGWMTDRGLGDGLAKELRPLLYNAWVLESAKAALAAQPVDVIIERLSLLGHVGIDLADALRVPLIVEVNALLTDEARQFRSLQLGGLADEIERRVLTRADAVLPVSRQLADQIAARGVPREKLHVIPNGADVQRFAAAPAKATCRAQLGLGQRFVAGFVGSLKPWHGADVLLAAFARVLAEEPEARLLVVGDGPEAAGLRELAQRLEIASAVVFIGAVEHDKVPLYLRAMDVAAAPYCPLDGFYFSPIKLFEYMAAGTSVVASDIGQCRDVIDSERNGLLCPPGDDGALSAALLRLARAPELRDRLAADAFQTVISQYTWRRAAEQTLEVVQVVLTRGESLCRAIDRDFKPAAAAAEVVAREVSIA